MKIIKIEEYITLETPYPGAPFRRHLLTNEHKAENFGGLFVGLHPGERVQYHYHKKRECFFVVISGEGTAIIEDKEITLKANDIMYIPSGEKHAIVNRTDKYFRYLEFFNYPPIDSDFIAVK